MKDGQKKLHLKPPILYYMYVCVCMDQRGYQAAERSQALPNWKAA